MPKMTREIEGADLCISRPVVLDVIRQVCIQLDLPKGLEVELMGDNPTPITTGSAISSRTNGVDFATDGKVKVNYKEQPIEDSWFQTHDFDQYQSSLLIDKRIKTKMYPIRDIRKVEVGMMFRFSSRSKAQRTLNFIRNRVSRLQKNFTHSVTYAYPLPDDIIATLYAIQQVKELQYGYEETAKDWLNDNAVNRIITVANSIGKEQTLAIETTDTGIIGGLNEELTPDREKGNKGITYMFTGTYTFYYAPPISVVLDYPMFIHQKALPERYRGVRNDRLTKPVDAEYNLDFKYLIKSEDESDTVEIKDGISIPEWDEWHDRFNHTLSDVRLYNLFISLDPPVEGVTEELLLDLNDLPYKLSDAAMNWINDYPTYVNRVGRTPFLIELWNWNEKVSPTEYRISSDGKVYSTITLDRRVNFHITITVIKKLSDLSLGTQDLIKNRPDLANEIVQFDKPGYVIPEIIPGVISDAAWDSAITPDGFTRKSGIMFATVQNTILTVLNKKEARNVTI